VADTYAILKNLEYKVTIHESPEAVTARIKQGIAITCSMIKELYERSCAMAKGCVKKDKPLLESRIAQDRELIRQYAPGGPARTKYQAEKAAAAKRRAAITGAACGSAPQLTGTGSGLSVTVPDDRAFTFEADSASETERALSRHVKYARRDITRLTPILEGLARQARWVTVAHELGLDLGSVATHYNKEALARITHTPSAADAARATPTESSSMRAARRGVRFCDTAVTRLVGSGGARSTKAARAIAMSPAMSLSRPGIPLAPFVR
jgi:hypothetical protein